MSTTSRPSSSRKSDRLLSAGGLALRVAAFAACLLCALGARAQTAAIQQHCFQGGTQAQLSGMSSTNYQQGIVPSCTVTVYLTETQTKATIYADGSSTPLSNPFTANAAGSLDPGGWIFWAAVNQGYDITLSGGIPPPNTYGAFPATLTDRYPSFEFSGAGAGLPHTNDILAGYGDGTAVGVPELFTTPVAGRPTRRRSPLRLQRPR